MRNIKTKRQSPTLSKIRSIKLPRELALAGKRIGESTAKRLKWLLSFADTDLGDLSEGQRTDLAWEIKAFMLPAEIAKFREASDAGEKVIIPPPSVPDQKAAMALFIPDHTISDQTMRLFQDFIRGGIKAGFDAGWDFKQPQITERLHLGVKNRAGPFRSFPSFEDEFKATAFNLVASEIGRIDRCNNPNCRKPFVTEKKGKGRFCSPRCSAYVRVARFRGKELSEAS